MQTVGTDRHPRGAIQTIGPVDAVDFDFHEGQFSVRRVATEDGDGVVVLTGHIDVQAIGADGHVLGRIQAVDVADVVGVCFNEG